MGEGQGEGDIPLPFIPSLKGRGNIVEKLNVALA